MPGIVNEEIAEQVKKVFANLTNPVEVLFFGKQTDCDFCAETVQLLEEVASYSSLFTVAKYDLDENSDLARQYKIDKAPGFVITAKEEERLVDYGIRYYGIPAGHEFTSLINDLVMVSARNSALNEDTREFLKSLDSPVILQVFVTPSCAFCPQAVVLAHQLAMESPWIEAEMIESAEFFDLASEYGVKSVPHTVINHGASSLVGVTAENRLIAEIRQVLQNQVDRTH